MTKTVTLPYPKPKATVTRERTLSDIAIEVAILKERLSKLEEELKLRGNDD